MKKYNIAIVGATGNVGREILNILDFRKFPTNNIFAVASSKSEGTKINYGNDKEIIVSDLEKFSFKNVDIVLSSAGSEISKNFSKKAVKSGSIIIDNTSCFRMDKDFHHLKSKPEDLKNYKKKNYCKPQLLNYSNGLALKPLQNQNKKIVVSSINQ